MKTKFAVLMRDHQAEVHERELGPVGPEQVLVKIETCNLCTTDYQQWMGLREKQGYPMAGGHENSGIVVEVGEHVKTIRLGDRVAFGYQFCGNCPACRQGNTFDCQHVDFDAKTPDGYKGDLGLATYKLAEAKYTVKIRNDMLPEQAGFLEPVGTAVHGINKLNLVPGELVVVVGAGTMGLVNAQVARAYGAKVLISELSNKKLARAREMGFDVIDASLGNPVETLCQITCGKGADVVIGAVGATKAYEQCMAMLKQNRGKFLVFAAGYPKPELHVDPNEVHYREIEIIGTMGGTISDFEKAAELLSKGLIDVSGCLEGKRFGLKDIQQAFEAAATPDSYRITVDCQNI